MKLAIKAYIILQHFTAFKRTVNVISLEAVTPDPDLQGSTSIPPSKPSKCAYVNLDNGNNNPGVMPALLWREAW